MPKRLSEMLEEAGITMAELSAQNSDFAFSTALRTAGELEAAAASFRTPIERRNYIDRVHMEWVLQLPPEIDELRERVRLGEASDDELKEAIIPWL